MRKALRGFLGSIWFRVIVYLLIAYAVWLGLLSMQEEQLLFQRRFAPRPPAHTPGGGVVIARFEIGDWVCVESLFYPAAGAGRGHPAPLAVFFHGNAEIVDYQDDIVRLYRDMGFAVLLPEYRGYGRSGGRPSEKAIVADSLRMLEALKQRDDVDLARVVYHGRSVGGAVAAQVALRRPPHALVLQSTFVSITSVAVRYGVPPFIVRNSFRTDRAMRLITIPALIFHGTRDSIVPVSHGRSLAQMGNDVTFVEFDCDHNDFPGDRNVAAYDGELRSFLVRAGLVRESAPQSEAEKVGSR